MKMSYEHQAVQKSSQNLETSQAQIMMTPEMLELLSSGVYEYKERAVVRELSCNALDGHKLKGNPDTPFFVHLPTVFEPYFEVRDYGVGLSHEQVMNLYINYGASTKSDSNEFIGAMGIGSKSPFALSDSFTVRSYFGGVVTTYQVYKENGIPQVTKLMSSKMDDGESTGLSVRVPINKQYMEKFSREAAWVFQTFAVRPETNIPLNYGSFDDNVLSQSKGEYVAFSSKAQFPLVDTTNSLFVVMGSIRYPVKLESIFDDEEYTQLMSSPILQAVSAVWVYVPIGTVAISASRESLQLNTETKKLVSETFRKISKDFLSDIQKEFDSKTTLKEATDCWKDLHSRSNSQTARYFLQNIVWKGKTLHTHVQEARAARNVQRIDPKTGEKMWVTDPKGNLKLDPKTGEPVPVMGPYESTCYDTYLMNCSGSPKNRLRVGTLSISPGEFSPWENSRPYFDGVIFVVYDRVTRSGKEKATGKLAVMQGIADDFEKDGRHVSRLCIVESRAEAEWIWNRHQVEDEYRHFVMASAYEHCYEPVKKAKSVVKLWSWSYSPCPEADSLGLYKENHVSSCDGDVNLVEKSEDGKTHLFLRANNHHVYDGCFAGAHVSDVAPALASLIDGDVVVFNKANWSKIPEGWADGSDEVVLRELIKDKPLLWKSLNILTLHCNFPSTIPNCYRMGVNAPDENYRFRKAFRGKVITLEGATSIFKEMFNRPVYTVRAFTAQYDSYGYLNALLALACSMVSTSKLRKSIRNARERQDEICRSRRTNYCREQHELLKFIDFDGKALVDLSRAAGISYEDKFVTDDQCEFDSY